MDSASLSQFCTLVMPSCTIQAPLSAYLSTAFLKKNVLEHTLVTLHYLYRYYTLDAVQLQVLKLGYKVKKYCQVEKSRENNYQVRRHFANVTNHMFNHMIISTAVASKKFPPISLSY